MLNRQEIISLDFDSSPMTLSQSMMYRESGYNQNHTELNTPRKVSYGKETEHRLMRNPLTPQRLSEVNQTRWGGPQGSF